MTWHLPQRAGLTQEGYPSGMVELVRTNDVVLIGLIEGLLEAEGIPALVADAHMGALEGSIGAFQRRVLIPEDWAPRARRLLTEAGLGAELRDA